MTADRYAALDRKVKCPKCRKTMPVRSIGNHRKKCDPTWTPGRVALVFRAVRARERAANAELAAPMQGGESSE